MCAGTVPAPEDPALKKEVELLHRREEELTTRLAAVEAELTTARSSKADLMAQAAELKRSVQVSSLLEVVKTCCSQSHLLKWWCLNKHVGRVFRRELPAQV